MCPKIFDGSNFLLVRLRISLKVYLIIRNNALDMIFLVFQAGGDRSMREIEFNRLKTPNLMFASSG